MSEINSSDPISHPVLILWEAESYIFFPRAQLSRTGAPDGDPSLRSAVCLSVFPSNPSTFSSTHPSLLHFIKYTFFIFKIKIYSVCNKNIESAHLRTSSHLKTAEHISNKKNLWYKWNIPTTRKIKEGDETTLYILLQMPQKGPRDSREHLL